MIRLLRLFIFIVALQPVYAQEPIAPRPSPLDMITMRYKTVYAKLTYSRPHKRGRELFGSLVPYGEVWRLGANEATEITFTGNVFINDFLLKAGTYSLFAIPNEDTWTIIVNADLGLWGSYNYNPKMDIVRFDVPVQVTDTVYEPFTMQFVQRNESADLIIRWDRILVSVPIRFVDPEQP